jgi:hypothetical protein
MLKYVTPEDHQKYFVFCQSTVRPLLKAPPSVIWHYTTGDGLIGILKSHTIFSTQISCMNDQSEFRYANGLYREALAAHPRTGLSADGQWALDKLIAGETEAAGDAAAVRNKWFVSSFSAARDDLSQWRAYGGGENGYAIGFKSEVIAATGRPQGSDLINVTYDQSQQRTLAAQVVAATIDFFTDGITKRRAPNRDLWAEEFYLVWSDYTAYFAPLAKDQAFKGEQEWRVVHGLTEADRPGMKYFQRRHFVSRHVPLRFPDGKGRLPIAEIIVGPARHKEVSRISVGDLLRTCGYADNEVKVETSPIPYQLT